MMMRSRVRYEQRAKKKEEESCGVNRRGKGSACRSDEYGESCCDEQALEA